MPRYADPARCPDCAGSLPAAPGTCPTCGLPLTGPLAGELLRTLRRADDLLTQLRVSGGVPSIAPSTLGRESAPTGADSAEISGRVGAYRRRLGTTDGSAGFTYPPPTPRRTGLRAPSVPKILLGLGATCLLVAAVIFLAVAWSWIGIGGRTAVLVVATVATGALAVRLGRRDLRIGAEALTAVSLGLLVLDLVGAQNAGWLGDLDGSGFVLLVGSAVAAAGAGLLAPLQRDQRRLVVPQLSVVAGAFVAMVAVHDLSDLTTLVLVVELLACAALVRTVLGRGVPFVVVGMSVVGVLGWSVLSLYGVSEAVAPDGLVTLRGLWIEGDGVALAAAVLLALLPIAVAPKRDAAWQAGLAVGAVMVTCTLVLPVLDNGGTAVAAAWLVALVVWTAPTAVVRRSADEALLAKASVAVLVPLGLSALAVASALVVVLGRAVDNVLGAGRTFDAGAGVRLDALATDFHPALIVPLTVALLLAAHVAMPWRRFVPQVAALALGAAGLVTMAQYDVPLWVVVAILGALGLTALADALRRPDGNGVAETVIGAALLAGATLVALPSAGLTAAALAVVLAVAALLLLLARALGRGDLAGLWVPVVVDRAAGAVVPLAWAGLVWATARALDTEVTWCALVIVGATGLFAIAVPRVEVELAATIAALLSAPAAIAAAGDQSVSLALHLTLAGTLVTVTSLVHRDRRLLAIPGGLLLAAATWVRLADLGVSAPEPYTLPLALVLLAVGLDLVRRQPTISTTSALLPGLLLGIVPSLLWALGDPVSVRALLLGAACLVLVLAGAQVRWSAPLVVGAVAGLVLVVRELAPYAGQTPQWVVIGLAGAVLTVVGVTWEKRLQDLQHASGFLGRLR